MLATAIREHVGAVADEKGFVNLGLDGGQHGELCEGGEGDVV